jgi:c-di-GMP-binding flagellar brake protein YcgR
LSEPASSPKKPSEFELVQDPLEATKLLIEAGRTHAKALIWTKEQRHVFDSQLVAFDPEQKAVFAKVPTSMDPDQFLRELAELKIEECFFSVSLPRANIFFRTQCLGHELGSFRFTIPAKVFNVQRRRAMRLLIPYGHTLKAEMQDPSFPEQKLVRKIIDISANGVAFIAPTAEEALFPKGLVIKQFSFAISRRRITVEAEVRHLRAQPEDAADPGVKVGVEFRKLKPSDSQWIACYVFEESRKVALEF